MSKKTSRRTFLKSLSAAMAFLAISGEALAATSAFISKKIEASVNGVLDVIRSLQAEGSNVVQKIMNGKKYKKHPLVHYPIDGGVFDKKTRYRVFFHAHSKNEYGHFHTFYEKPNGDLVHLIMVSMNKKGYPIKLSATNRWVTGDVFVKADELKELFSGFMINEDLFPDPRIGKFIQELFTAYKNDIFKLMDERDKAIYHYVKEHTRTPFEDRSVEILSSKSISVSA